MFFSKACEYGMRAAIYVAQESESDKKVSVKDIAKAIESPEPFTGKIMQKLTKNGLIQSVKGPYGGFFVDEAAMKKTKLSDIITLFDGKNAYSGCVLGLRTCSDKKPCPLHKESEPIVDSLRSLLENKSLYDVIYTDEVKNKFWLKTE